jgi:hypothetical protein
MATSAQARVSGGSSRQRKGNPSRDWGWNSALNGGEDICRCGKQIFVPIAQLAQRYVQTLRKP